MSSQKKMEEAFLKQLRHLLSRKYKYTIVADRGFGHSICFTQMLTMLVGKEIDKNYKKLKKKVVKLYKKELSIIKQTSRIIINFYDEAIKVLNSLFLIFLSPVNSS